MNSPSFVPSRIVDLTGLPQRLQRLPVVTTRGNAFYQGLYTGSSTSQTYRVNHTVAKNATDLRPVYANFYQNGDVDTLGPNSIAVTASLEIAGTLYRVTVNGKQSFTVDPGAWVVADPIAVDVSAGDVLYSRTCPAVSSGQKWPVGTATNVSIGDGGGTGQGDTVGNAGVDLTGSGSVTASTGYSYSPAMILGLPSDGTTPSSVAILGDSIDYGFLDITGSFTSGYDQNGFYYRGFNGTVNYLSLATTGAAVVNVAPVANRWQRSRYWAGFSHAIVGYGVNDIVNSGRTLVQLQTDLTTLWTSLSRRGIKVYQRTLLPNTTSTDSFATAANQTPVANMGPGSIRTQLNDWIRALPSPLTGCVETADLVEVNSSGVLTRNAGYWLPGNTSDGLHPNATGHTTLAAAAAAFAGLL